MGFQCWDLLPRTFNSKPLISIGKIKIHIWFEWETEAAGELGNAFCLTWQKVTMETVTVLWMQNYNLEWEISNLRRQRLRNSRQIQQHAKSFQSYPTLCDPVDHSLPGSSVRGIFQARILEWVAMSFSGRSSPPRHPTRISRVSCIGRQVLYH